MCLHYHIALFYDHFCFFQWCLYLGVMCLRKNHIQIWHGQVSLSAHLKRRYENLHESIFNNDKSLQLYIKCVGLFIYCSFIKGFSVLWWYRCGCHWWGACSCVPNENFKKDINLLWIQLTPSIMRFPCRMCLHLSITPPFTFEWACESGAISSGWRNSARRGFHSVIDFIKFNYL